VGIGLGRALWSAFARGIGVPSDAVTPVLSVAVVAAVTIVVAIALSTIPGRRAGRVRPAEVLRSE
jgi:ABC-type antimicrobial peptide transport system permease subunit